MPVEHRIARRYFWAARRRAHTFFLAVISMLGLAIGVFALLVLISLLSGLQGQIKERLIASSPQLLIEPAGRIVIDDADAIIAAARRLGSRDVRPIVAGIGWGANDRARRGRPMRIRSGAETSPDDIELTRDYAASIGVTRGDDVVVVAPRTRLTPFGPAPVWRKYRVARLRPTSTSETAG